MIMGFSGALRVRVNASRAVRRVPADVITLSDDDDAEASVHDGEAEGRPRTRKGTVSSSSSLASEFCQLTITSAAAAAPCPAVDTAQSAASTDPIASGSRNPPARSSGREKAKKRTADAMANTR